MLAKRIRERCERSEPAKDASDANPRKIRAKRPNIRLAWVTTLEVLPNGHYMIGNCHAGPGQPLLIELDPTTKKVIWTFDQFDRFGNSVPNSQILDAPGAIR